MNEMSMGIFIGISLAGLAVIIGFILPRRK